MLITRDRVLVEFEKVPDHSTSGLIYIPHEARKGATVGRVLEVGPQQFDVKPGDKIVFGRFAGVPIKSYEVWGPEKAILDGSEILAVFVDEEVESNTERITYSLDEDWIRDIISKSEFDIIYMQYSHQAKILYVTVERLKIGKPEEVLPELSVCDTGEGRESKRYEGTYSYNE